MTAKPMQTIAHGTMLIAVLLGLIAAALWLRPAEVESKAHARRIIDTDKPGIPDSGRQRQKMIKELEAIGATLGQIKAELQGLRGDVETISGGLRGGDYTVKVVAPKAKQESGK